VQYLGASVGLTRRRGRPIWSPRPGDYLEGYLWDPPEAKEAFRAAIGAAKAAGRRVALPSRIVLCRERHRAEFLALVEKRQRHPVRERREITALYETASVEEAVAAVRDGARSRRSPFEHGSMVVTADAVHELPAAPVQGVDTTGAATCTPPGSCRAHRGRPLPDCARLAGSRPPRSSPRVARDPRPISRRWRASRAVSAAPASGVRC